MKRPKGRKRSFCWCNDKETIRNTLRLVTRARRRARAEWMCVRSVRKPGTSEHEEEKMEGGKKTEKGQMKTERRGSGWKRNKGMMKGRERGKYGINKIRETELIDTLPLFPDLIKHLLFHSSLSEAGSLIHLHLLWPPTSGSAVRSTLRISSHFPEGAVNLKAISSAPEKGALIMIINTSAF